ncbi:MAG TPA: DUF4349 domain-containing protein [Gaiellales bacterium]|jgi:hypothetical protein|nr:DUF4349 domain-containing protein [Gaiellales bacterium]
MRFSTVAAITAVLVAASGVAGCSGSSSGSAGSAAPAPEKQVFGEGASGGGIARDAISAPGSAVPATQHASVSTNRALPQMPSTVIKTGRISIRLGHGDLAKAVDRASQVVLRYGGFISSSSISSGKHESSTIVLRVPADRFDQAMTDLRAPGIGSVRSDQRSGEDVGQQFVDLSARARNLRAQSRALIRLMNQAVTVSDTIKIQNELFDIQGQIEELEGRLRYLHDQADMSTITMLLTPPAVAHDHHGQATAIGSALRRSWQRATDVVTAVIVGAGVVIPVALLALVVLLASLRLLPAVRRRTSHAIETTAAE